MILRLKNKRRFWNLYFDRIKDGMFAILDSSLRGWKCPNCGQYIDKIKDVDLKKYQDLPKFGNVVFHHIDLRTFHYENLKSLRSTFMKHMISLNRVYLWQKDKENMYMKLVVEV